MADTERIQGEAGDVVVLLGTSKGLFALSAGPERTEWRLAGPWFLGEEIYSAALDCRNGRTRLLVGATSSHWGPSVYRSDDLGATWIEPEPSTLRFPEETGAAVAHVWQLQPAGDAQPDVVYAGVEPAALFRSDDGGESFTLDQNLWDHPHRAQWQPGGGGLCLHTVLPDPDGGDRMAIAVSAAGFYRTLDGTTWEAANSGIAAPFLPEPTPEFGQCVHKVDRHPSQPDTLFLQHHWGVYRSDDFGGSWTEVGGDKLPSTFGFPMVVDPNNPGHAYVLPLTSDLFRCTPDGRFRVYRTTDGGDSWEGLERGLPQRDAWSTVLRDAFTADALDPAGLYVGTRTGEVYASPDAGDTWQELASHLPPVLCVKTAVLR
ncbi:MAG: glycosyl hydrolase repeat-containing glycosyl hydrolase [Acidimicrobiales bacterium]|nr:glycosyl hydrolase repeat-containing glycosyl hydrolase [Acidimicrobiales bacterium]